MNDKGRYRAARAAKNQMDSPLRCIVVVVVELVATKTQIHTHCVANRCLQHGQSLRTEKNCGKLVNVFK